MYRYFGYGMALDLGSYYTSSDRNLRLGLTVDHLGAQLVDYTNQGITVFPWSLNAAVTKKFEQAPLVFGFQYNNFQRWDLASADQDALNNTNTDPLTGKVTRPVVTLDNFARHVRASVVFVPSEKFQLLLAYDFRRRLELAITERPGLVGFSFGTYIQVKRFGIQYAITSYHLGGASNHLAITTNLNEWYHKRTIE
jgi:hypothetical protein